MSDDLIRRSDALEVLLKQEQFARFVTRRALCQIPAVDAVEIVRCKDCKHQKILQGSQGAVKTCGLGWGLSGIVLGDDFCSYGERRKDNG